MPKPSLLSVALLALASSAGPARAAGNCDELLAQIDAKVRAAGVTRFTLTDVAADAAVNGKVVGTCERGSRKIVYQAEASSTTDRFELLAAPRGAPDDLAKITGVGPQIEKKLNEHGVFHYWQLAAMTTAEAAKLDADLKFNGRVARDKWSDQARALMAAE